VAFGFYGLCGLYRHRPAHSRGGLVTFVAAKVTKTAFSRKASLPHGAFGLQIGQNHGLQSFLSGYPFLSQTFDAKNLLCPSLRFSPPLFCPISAEADLLKKTKCELINNGL